MNLLYHLGLWLYRLIARLMSPFYAKAALFTKGRNGLISNIKQKVSHDKPIVWFHCASLGEFEQGRPIIEGYKIREPEHKILLTFFSPSGYEVRKEHPVADWVFYMPLDTRRNARRFLDAVQPSKAIFVKYEFWYNFLIALKKREIPTYVVSATFRPSQPFFRWYGAFFRRMLRNFTLLFVQNQASKELLAQIGFNNAVMAGDTRFDRVWAQAQLSCHLPVVEAFCGSDEKQDICVVGSSWAQDEALLLQALKERMSLKLILAPHEIDASRIGHIMEQFASFCPVRYSQASVDKVVPPESRVLVVDTMGL
ncbi:MAG: polysaccharide pyruvyl transferase family protein, partial [Bacteroidales bacterium]|nr:polysaccharide pyruvyl transferase family protein [Bacteroidales bacterium]